MQPDSDDSESESKLDVLRAQEEIQERILAIAAHDERVSVDTIAMVRRRLLGYLTVMWLDVVS